MINNNTTSKHPTHFLRGVELVDLGMKKYGVPSENWAYPTQYNFGMPSDHYYAEVWCNGMDWQSSYWIIEELDLEKPQIQPFIIFNDYEEQEKFNVYDFGMLVMAAFYYRRDYTFINHKDLGYYNDMVWPFLRLLKDETLYEKCKLFAFEHASQKQVAFWMNTTFVPSIVINRRNDENNRSDGNPQTQLGGSVGESKSCIIRPVPGR